MDKPIACTLSPSALADRTREMAALRRDALLDRAPIPGGVRLVFADAPGVERRLRAVIDAEAACCPFVTLRLERDAEHLILDVTGPEDALPIIEEVFA